MRILFGGRRNAGGVVAKIQLPPRCQQPFDRFAVMPTAPYAVAEATTLLSAS